MKKLIVNPLSVGKKKEPIQSVLRALAGQNNCDGEPYDQMQEAADYIDKLEKKLREYKWCRKNSRRRRHNER